MQKFASIVKYNEQLSDKKTKQGPSGKLKVPQMWYIWSTSQTELIAT